MSRAPSLGLVQDTAGTADQTGVDSIVTGIERTVTQYVGISASTQEKILESLIIIAILWLLRAVTIRFTLGVDDVRSRYRWRKVITYVVAMVGLLLVGRVWFEGVAAIATYLGLISAGIAISLRDPLVNIAGWIFLMWRRPFVVGDRIEIDGRAGDVIDVRLFQFTLLEIGGWVDSDQSTGRIIHVPNGKVFTESAMNYTQGFPYIWNELPVLVTYESDWKKAKRLLLEIADHNVDRLSEEAERRVLQASRKFMIFYSTLTPTVYTRVAPSGILLTIRYLTEPRRRRGGGEKLWEAILDAFAEHDDIDFAYPTQRLYFNPYEGKPGARAPLTPPPSPPSSE